jgi:hypothetical protein
MTLANRRQIADQAIQSLQARGTQFDDDPRIREWIEEWVEGAISMETVRLRYLQLLRLRAIDTRLAYLRGHKEQEKGRSTLAGSALSNPDSLEHQAEPRQEDIETGDDP